MERIFDALVAMGCFVLISTLWLAALGLLASVLMQGLYGFAPLSLPGWKALYASFLQGGTVPLGFILYVLALMVLAGSGEIAILWRLPAIAAAMPSPRLPRLALPRIALPPIAGPARRPRPSAVRAEPVMGPLPAPPAAPPIPAPPPPPAPAPEGKISDSAILARILALFDVWNEPPPAWMAEALRDEVVLLSPEAWPTLESMGGQGLDLLVTLREHDMLPESPAALRAIGEVETILRSGAAAGLEAPAEGPTPALTLAACWLCEALDNVLAAQADPAMQPERVFMAQSMFDRALRGMADTDWASLDRFPEKAGRIRMVSEHLREDMRATAARAAAAPANPAEAVIALLQQSGFTCESGGPAAPLLALRDDLLLLLQLVDLAGGDWRLPSGLLGPWLSAAAPSEASPARALWQQLARRRLRHADPRPLAGLLVVHGGRLEQEEHLAEMVAADRRRRGIGLAWLSGGTGLLPSLERELTHLPDRLRGERHRERAADHFASPP